MYTTPNSKKTKAIEYESKIYEQVVKFMNKGDSKCKPINPNFVTFYGNGVNCTYDKMLSMLVNGGMTRENAERNFMRNSIFMMNDLNGVDRPSITNNKTIQFSNNVTKPTKRTRYNFIATKPSNGTTLIDFAGQVRNDPNEVHIMADILVHVMTALNALSVLGVVHNDLHPGNLFIRDINTKETYKIDGNCDGTTFSSSSKYGGRFTILIEDICPI